MDSSNGKTLKLTAEYDGETFTRSVDIKWSEDVAKNPDSYGPDHDGELLDFAFYVTSNDLRVKFLKDRFGYVSKTKTE